MAGRCIAGDAWAARGSDAFALAGNAQVAAWRNQYGADLVSMLVQDGLGSCGIGYVMRSVGACFATSGFQVTASGCAVGNLSYAHEHGHNMGMEHDPPNGTTPSNASYPWSFGHIVDGSYRTVMAYASACTAGCTRRPFFFQPGRFLPRPTKRHRRYCRQPSHRQRHHTDRCRIPRQYQPDFFRRVRLKASRSVLATTRFMVMAAQWDFADGTRHDQRSIEPWATLFCAHQNAY